MDDAALIASCARRVARGLSPGLTHDDLLQEGRIALWLAQRAGRVPDDPEHRRRYLRTRATGAMRGANGRARRQFPMTVDELDENFEGNAAATPDVILQMRECVEYLSVHVSRMRDCIELLAEGLSGGQVAERLGVTPSRISQLRREARRAAAAFI